MITAVAHTHVGVVREVNEDSLVVAGLISVGSLSAPMRVSIDGDGLFAVVDGMGGHRGGQEASQLVARELAQVGTVHPIERVKAVNDLLYKVAGCRPELTGMGATIAGLQSVNGVAIIFNVGDARVYQWSEGYLMLLTTDDRISPDSNVVTQSLGGADRPTAIEVHTTESPMRGADRFLICSDGLSEVVPFDQIQEVLADPSATVVAERLLQAALDGGGPDNVSLIVVEPAGDG